MNTRERLLLIGVVSVAVVFLAKRLVSAVFIDPLRNLDSKVARTRESIDRIKSVVAMRPEIRRRLDLLRRLSLPDSVSVATSLYQRYLNEKLQEAGLGATMSAPKISRSKGNYSLVSYTISGKARLESVVRFLYLFYRDPLLQEIESLRVSPYGKPGSDILSFSMKATGMAMAGTPVRADLVPPGGVPNDERAPGARLVKLHEADFKGVVEKHIFRRGWTPPPPPPKSKKKAPARRVVQRHAPRVDPAQYQRLKGMTDTGDVQMAWIEDTRSNRNLRHRVGDKLAIGELAAIDLYHVVIKIGENYYKVRVGKTLAEREALSAEERQRLREVLR